MMKTTMIVCCHKKDVHVEGYPYLPLHVGKALSDEDLGIQGDDSGDNISVKNRSYCELTGLYWAWKNLKDSDIIGLCHYRRCFDFNNQAMSILPYTLKDTIDGIDFSLPEKLQTKIMAGKVVVPRALNNVGSIYNEYCVQHYCDDLRVLEKVVEEVSPQYKPAFDKVMHLSHKTYNYNMFIMNRELLDKYCHWLFSVLELCEKRIDISNYSPLQKRIFGYMGERLINVFIEAEKIDTIQKPLWFIMKGEQGSKFRYIVKCMLNNIGFFFSTLYIRLNRFR